MEKCKGFVKVICDPYPLKDIKKGEILEISGFDIKFTGREWAHIYNTLDGRRISENFVKTIKGRN